LPKPLRAAAARRLLERVTRHFKNDPLQRLVACTPGPPGSLKEAVGRCVAFGRVFRATVGSNIDSLSMAIALRDQLGREWDVSKIGGSWCVTPFSRQRGKRPLKGVLYRHWDIPLNTKQTCEEALARAEERAAPAALHVVGVVVAVGTRRTLLYPTQGTEWLIQDIPEPGVRRRSPPDPQLKREYIDELNEERKKPKPLQGAPSPSERAKKTLGDRYGLSKHRIHSILYRRQKQRRRAT
jgi:hypothetical protein